MTPRTTRRCPRCGTRLLRHAKPRRIAYEEYLKRIAELARRVDAGHADDIPQQLKKSPGLRALYNNLKQGMAASATSSAETHGVDGADPALDLALPDWQPT